MAPVTFEDSPACGGTTLQVCLIYEEHKEREHESDDEVEVINADLVGNDEEVSDYGGDPEDAEATILEVWPDQANHRWRTSKRRWRTSKRRWRTWRQC